MTIVAAEPLAVPSVDIAEDALGVAVQALVEAHREGDVIREEIAAAAIARLEHHLVGRHLRKGGGR